MTKKKQTAKEVQNNITVIDRTVPDFLNNEYKAYSKYVIATRALPSIVDGFKTGARKIMHAAFHGGLKNGQERKVLNLVGDVYNLTLFQHGDASLYGTVFTEGAEFADNLNPLDIIGQHGSLRDPKAISAPRYLSVKLSEFADLYKVDEDLLEYIFDEGQFIEPKNYLPIIPTVLTSRTKGMAPGYAFECFSYNPLDIIQACKEVLKKGTVKKTLIRPYVRGIDENNFIYDSSIERWVNNGAYKTDYKADVLQITDLPYSISFDKLEKKLNGYIDSGYIRDWKNYSHDDVIDYRVLFPKGTLEKLMAEHKDTVIKNLMLQALLPKDLLYVLDENGKVKNFDSVYELLTYFVNLRLVKYNDRKSRLLECLKKKLEANSNMVKFIDLVISKKLKISNRPIKEVQEDMEKHKLPVELLKTAISKLTKEERDALVQKNADIQAEIDYVVNTTTTDMYINDLDKLYKTLSYKF